MPEAISVQVIVYSIIALVAGLVGGYCLRLFIGLKNKKSAETKAGEIIQDAEKQAEETAKAAKLEAKEKFFKLESRFERELQRRKHEIERVEQKLAGRETNLDRKIELTDRRDKSLLEKEKMIDTKLKSIDTTKQETEEKKKEAVKKLEEITGLTNEQAKNMLLQSLEDEVRQEASALIRRVEQETKELSAKKSRQIITLAIQKCATDQVSETTVSVINLQSDEMKGRIIGREGRNIRALEAATGVNIIVDDTPEAVVLSSFDPMRREVARLSLEKLISDGRIHPARIEEIVEKTQKELREHVREIGEQLAFDVGVHGLHPELIRLLGRLKYRTSFGQNVLLHSQEVAYLAKVMAGELNVDVNMAKRAGLLHDIGKAVDYEIEGTHARIGADLARKYNESPAIVHAIAAHHADEEPKTIIAVLVQAADAISAARPGARRESLESYVQRLEKLEHIADSFAGVAKSYAIQAGREIRIIVEPEELNDNDCTLLARNVTKRIEQELEYPGQIKVTVIRQTRAVEYAK